MIPKVNADDAHNHPPCYRCSLAEALLLEQAAEMGLASTPHPSHPPSGKELSSSEEAAASFATGAADPAVTVGSVFSSIFMVGDNPAADVR